MASAPSESLKRVRECGDDTQPSKMARHSGVERTELTRLLVDALQQLGHASLAHQLEEESVRRCAPELSARSSRLLQGVPLHSPSAAALRQCVEGGDWDGACDALATLLEGASAQAPALWLLRRAQLCEALLRNDIPAALKVLRERLARLGAPQAACASAAALLLHTASSPAWREELAAAAAKVDAAAHPKLASAVADTPCAPFPPEEAGASAGASASPSWYLHAHCMALLPGTLRATTRQKDSSGGVVW